MEINPNIGISSIRVLMENGVVSNTQFFHRPPIGIEFNDEIQSQKENELLIGFNELREKGKIPSDGKIGFFIEYTSESLK